MTLSVNLLWPPSSLSPNARAHWAAKSRAAAKARKDAAMICRASGLRALGWDGMIVTVEFRAPSRRSYDLDNALSRCKSLLDGVADASGVDDSLWDIRIKRGEPAKGGAVIVTVQPPVPFQSIGSIAARLHFRVGSKGESES